MGWRSIKSAPRDGKTILVKTKKGRELLVSFQMGFEKTDGTECGGWCADYYSKHPKCWTDGVCWNTNENGKPSDPPIKWKPAPTTRKHGSGG